jgi:hypothetical protein
MAMMRSMLGRGTVAGGIVRAVAGTESVRIDLVEGSGLCAPWEVFFRRVARPLILNFWVPTLAVSKRGDFGLNSSENEGMQQQIDPVTGEELQVKFPSDPGENSLNDSKEW